MSDSFSLPGSFSLVSSIKHFQTKPTKKCQLYINERDHMQSSMAKYLSISHPVHKSICLKFIWCVGPCITVG